MRGSGTAGCVSVVSLMMVEWGGVSEFFFFYKGRAEYGGDKGGWCFFFFFSFGGGGGGGVARWSHRNRGQSRTHQYLTPAEDCHLSADRKSVG